MESQQASTNANITEDMLQCFWDLASLDSAVRIKATTSLLALLQSLEPADPESTPLSESSMPLDKAIEGCHPKVAYSLKRLCKGLASSRKAARQGFALALTVLLQEIPYFNDDKIISLILQSFKYSSAHSTDRDVYFGHILGLGSIARIRTIGSGVCQELIEQALWLSGEKSFLRKAAMVVILETVEEKPHDVALACLDSESLKAWLGIPWQDSSPEALAVSLRLWHLMPSNIIDLCSLLPSSSRQPTAELFKKGRQEKSKADRTAAMAVFAEDNLKRYRPALRKITQESTSLHSAWSCLLTFLLPGVEMSWLTNFSSSVKYDCLRKVRPDETDLKRFWNILIEDDIFGAKSTERMFQGFAIAYKLINCIEPKFFKALLTPNFLRALSRHCSKNDNVLFTIANQIVKTSISLVPDMDNSSRLMFVNAFRKYNIAGIKESLTAQLARSSADLQDSEVSVTIKQLQEEFENTATLTSDEKLNAQESIMIVFSEQARNISLHPTQVADIFAFLVEQIIFKCDVEEGLSDHRLTAAFITAFDTAMRTRLGKGTDPIRHAECKLILEQLTARCDQLTDARRQLMTVETPTQLEAVLDILRHLRRSLTSEFETQKARSHKLYSIFYFLSLAEFYIMANPTLVDICMAYEVQELLSWDLGIARSDSKTEKHTKEGANDEGKVEGDILDAFVEAFLKIVTFNFAPLPSAPLRDAAEHLFRLYSPHVTETGVSMLMDYVAGHFVNGDVNEGSEDEDEGLEATTDKDADHTSEDEEVAANEEEGSESDGNHDDNENDSDMEEEIEGDGEDEEEDVSFGDDQMFQLDATLGAYFNSLRNGGNKKMNEQERNGYVMRVLSCINVLIKKQSQSPNLLKIPAILLTVLSIGRKREIPTLVQKINGLLESMVKCKCLPEAVHAAELEFQLRRTLYLASRHNDPQVRRAAINGYIYLLRASLQNEDCKHVGKDSVLLALSDYFDKKKSKLGIHFFQQLSTRLPKISEFIIPSALNKCNSARNNFMRGAGVAILEFAVKNATEGIDEIFCRVSSDVEKLFFDIIASSGDKAKSSANVIKAAQGLAQAMKSKGLGFAKTTSHAKAKKALQALDEVATKTPKGTNLARLVDSLYDGCVTEAKRKRASQNLTQKKARK